MTIRELTHLADLIGKYRALLCAESPLPPSEELLLRIEDGVRQRIKNKARDVR